MTMPLLKQSIWGHIWKHTVDKIQTNATNATMPVLSKAIWGNIWKRTVEKIKQMQPMWLCIILCEHFEDTFENAQWWKVKQMQPMLLFASSYASTLRTHLKMQSEEKCNQCDYVSSEQGVLRRHLKTHCGEKSNKCNQCDFASPHRSSLRIHMNHFRMMAICHLELPLWGLIWKHENPWCIVGIQFDEININNLSLDGKKKFTVGAKEGVY